MSLSDRELEYYAVKCGNTVMNGVILQNWSTFVGSESITCDYLYCSFVDENNAIKAALLIPPAKTESAM